MCVIANFNGTFARKVTDGTFFKSKKMKMKERNQIFVTNPLGNESIKSNP